MNQQVPKRPRRCGSCNMFGHNRRKCHLIHDVVEDPKVTYQNAMTNWQKHSYTNGQWVAAGGTGHTIPSPKLEDFIPIIPKTPFELACENKCKVIHEDTCCICIEALGEKNIATTPCGHQFHFGCLAQHISRSNNCPTCRGIICPAIVKEKIQIPTTPIITSYITRTMESCLPEIIDICAYQSLEPGEMILSLDNLMTDTLLHSLRGLARAIVGYNE